MTICIRRPIGSIPLILLAPLLARGQAPSSAPDAMSTAAPWVAVEDGLRELRLLSNDILRQDRSQALAETARRLEGTTIWVEMLVDRVTPAEVILEATARGSTRIVFEHREAPPHGNLRTVYYAGGPATQRANLLSQPFALRIGNEIALAAARPLQKYDRIAIRGTIGTALVHNEGWFHPQLILIVRDWTASVAAPDGLSRTDD